MNIKRFTVHVCSFVSLLVLLSNRAFGATVSFDYPGGFSTSGIAINSTGAITGNYFDGNGNQHGFIRNPDGSFVGFDVPGAGFTSPVAINDAGAITGQYGNASGVVLGAFVRDPSGMITPFTVGTSPAPWGINNSNVIVGTTKVGSATTTCFLRDASGVITTFMVNGSTASNCTAINNAGTIAGWLGGTSGQGFIRNSSGVVTTFQVLSLRTFPRAINNVGVVTGTYMPTPDHHNGFVWNSGGTATTFNISGAADVWPQSINLSGTVVGYWVSPNFVVHAFAQTATGDLILDPIGATFAEATGINDSGTATGFWTDSNFAGHGLVTGTSCSGPTINTVTASPNTLWPPNNKLVPVTISVSTAGGCGSVTCRILTVTSNETVSPGIDWVITGPLTVNLRATRDGAGQGRTYTISILCTDGSGNSTSSKVTVFVPHDQR